MPEAYTNPRPDPDPDPPSPTSPTALRIRKLLKRSRKQAAAAMESRTRINSFRPAEIVQQQNSLRRWQCEAEGHVVNPNVLILDLWHEQLPPLRMTLTARTGRELDGLVAVVAHAFTGTHHGQLTPIAAPPGGTLLAACLRLLALLVGREVTPLHTSLVADGEGGGAQSVRLFVREEALRA